jgi:uncharacterized DUF497 family protein
MRLPPESGDPMALTIVNPDDSEDEDRFLTFGESGDGRLIIVSYTDRGDHLGIISARRATRKERKLYPREPCRASRAMPARARRRG